MNALDVKLACRKSDSLDDWYIIERAEHDGASWWEPDEYGHHLMTSARIGDADIEGGAEHMRGIATAIREKTYESFRRCAARWTGAGVELWSPRNSSESTLVTHASALALADSIDAVLAGVEGDAR